MITTLFNEGETVRALIDSLLAQTLPPDEIVVMDAGSSDGTTEILREYAEAGAPVRVLIGAGNRSAGRNVAIAAARNQIIAATDGGCIAEPDWLENLVAPFSEGADWVAGFYRPEGVTLRSTCIGLVMVYVREEVGPGFLPSARSVAFRRGIAEQIGGFPEDLEFAEDTMFDQRLVDAGHTPVFALDAVVRWRPPETFRQLAATMFRWGKGDGIAGLRGNTYKRIASLYGGSAVALAAAAVFYPVLVPVAGLPLAWHGWKATRHKYAWADGVMKFVYIPVAHHTARVSSLIGFLVGRRRRP